MQDSLRDLHPSGLLQLCGIRYTGMLQHGDSQHRPTGQLLLLPSEVAVVTSTKPAGVSNPQALEFRFKAKPQIPHLGEQRSKPPHDNMPTCRGNTAATWVSHSAFQTNSNNQRTMFLSSVNRRQGRVGCSSPWQPGCEGIWEGMPTCAKACRHVPRHANTCQGMPTRTGTAISVIPGLWEMSFVCVFTPGRGLLLCVLFPLS